MSKVEPAPQAAPDEAALLLADWRALAAAGTPARADADRLDAAEAGLPTATRLAAAGSPAGEGRQGRVASGIGIAGQAAMAGDAVVDERRRLAQAATDAPSLAGRESLAAFVDAAPPSQAQAQAQALHGLPLQAASLAAPSAPTTVGQASLAAAPGSAEFSSQLGAQLTTFVREGVQHARLHLNPAELGPVTVRIQIDGQAAQVHLAAEHALTRQALEQSMPQLAGSLREAGLTLSGGGVFEQPRQRDGDNASAQSGRGDGDAAGSGGGETAPRAMTAAPARRGVVDLVA